MGCIFYDTRDALHVLIRLNCIEIINAYLRYRVFCSSQLRTILLYFKYFILKTVILYKQLP